jgi:hypothetical protein
MTGKHAIVLVEQIERAILLIRGQKVMLDRDLAGLYGVETKQLKQAVKRNIERFPDDFMFQLTREELENWRSQFVTSKADKMGLRYPPMAFTEQGVAMLSSVLRSKRAVQVKIDKTRVESFHNTSQNSYAIPQKPGISRIGNVGFYHRGVYAK